MKIRIIKIGANFCIHLPQDMAVQLKLKKGQKVAIGYSSNGLLLCKPTIFDEMDFVFSELKNETDDFYYKLKQKYLTDKINENLKKIM